MDQVATEADRWRLIPPVPAVPARSLGLRAFLRAIRTNALTIWPEAAYTQDFTVRHFLGRMNVLVNAPDAIHRVLVENAENYRRSPASIRILRPITGNGLLLSEGEDWRLQRRTIAPALAPRVMPMLARHIVAVTAERLDVLAQQAAAGPVDLLAALQSLTLEIAGRSLFSLEMAAFGAPLRRLLGEFESLSRPFMLDMLLPPSVPTLRDLRRRRFQARWMGLIEQIMRDRLRAPQPDTPRDLFDLLRAARDPETGVGFSPTQLRDQLATLLLAGHETTALVLFWTLTLLAQDGVEQARVAAEARGVTIEPDGAVEALGGLVRTRAVVSEALRLYPPAFAIVREAIGPDRLGDFELSKHAVVMIAPWVLHRHKSLWRNPATFDPDRFMPEAPAVPRFSYLPFGVGPRVCVGAQFALTEAVVVLGLLLQRFEIGMAETQPVLPVGIVTTQPDRAAEFWLRAVSLREQSSADRIPPG
ncbi:MAG TPA: cytochrome P450 [Acetobacteraceae bacterium]|nr:cytochrome P450 [Acetobacteraceae bacterium]